MPILACITRREVQYLAQQDTKSTYSEIADFHTKQGTKKKHQNHDRKTAHETTVHFVFFCQLNIHLSAFYFLPRKFYCTRVARIKYPHRTSTGAGHVLMGLPLIYGSPRRGESEPYPGGCLPTLRFSSCGQEHSVHYHQVHLIWPQTVRCWMLGFRSCATPLGTPRRGTLYSRIHMACKYETRVSTKSSISQLDGVYFNVSQGTPAPMLRVGQGCTSNCSIHNTW